MPWPKGVPQSEESKTKNRATHLSLRLNVKHGHASRSGRSPTWAAWRSMIGRCTYPSQSNYPRYGGRGIRVCDAWRASFEAFLADVGERPGPEYSLGRIDNDGNYEPGNVRWETAAQQAGNKRPWGTQGRNPRRGMKGSRSCLPDCTCGRHRGNTCHEGCTCARHAPKTLSPEHRAKISASLRRSKAT